MLLAANGKSITDLHTLLCDNDFRDILLESVGKRKSESSEYSLLLDTWSQYKKLMRTDQWIVWVEPILTRIGVATSHRGIVEILTSSSNNIDLRKVITERQILLVKFDVSTDPRLLSGLLVAGLMDAAIFSDARTENRSTALYVDHLDAILTKASFEALTRETHKNRIGIVATLESLHSLSENFRELLFTNAGRIMSFVIPRKEAALLGPYIFKDRDGLNNGNVSEHSGCEQLTSLQLHEFCYSPSEKVGTFKIQANKPFATEDAKVDKALMQRILNNSNRVNQSIP
jgi:hypothetical protein